MSWNQYTDWKKQHLLVTPLLLNGTPLVDPLVLGWNYPVEEMENIFAELESYGDYDARWEWRFCTRGETSCPYLGGPEVSRLIFDLCWKSTLPANQTRMEIHRKSMVKIGRVFFMGKSSNGGLADCRRVEGYWRVVLYWLVVWLPCFIFPEILGC